VPVPLYYLEYTLLIKNTICKRARKKSPNKRCCCDIALWESRTGSIFLLLILHLIEF
jgi:hypothetical protein